MIYFLITLFSILFLAWSYIFIKTYQLCGYNISVFLDSVFSLNLSFGDKSKLNFTKRMLRFIALYTIISVGIFILIFLFIKNVWLIILDLSLMFFFQPAVLILVHYLLLPIEILIKKFYIFKLALRNTFHNSISHITCSKKTNIFHI